MENKDSNMKHLFVIALAAVAMVLGGCETESSDQIAVSISPSYVTMTEGESRTFTASGWQDYSWRLEGDEDNIGVLSTTKGDSVVYTALQNSAKTNGTSQQTLVVTVNVLADNVSGATNTNVSAQSLITITYTP